MSRRSGVRKVGGLVVVWMLSMFSGALASSVSLSSGLGDTLAPINAGLGPLALEGEYSLTEQFSVGAGVGYLGAVYAGLGAQYHLESTVQGPFVGARASYFSGAGLDAFGLSLLGGFRSALPAPVDRSDLEQNARLQYDLLLSLTPYYQNSAQPELSGLRLGFSVGVRLGVQFPQPAPPPPPEPEPLPVFVR